MPIHMIKTLVSRNSIDSVVANSARHPPRHNGTACTPGRQPALGLDVVHEEQAPVLQIDRNEVRH